MKQILLLTIAAFILVGCAQQNQSFWEKPGASGKDFEMDKAQCNAQAFSVPGANMMTVVVIQNQCLRGKGWYLTDTPNTAPSRAQQTNDVIKGLQDQIGTIGNKPQYAPVIAKTPSKNTDIVFAHLSDKTKITPEQKTLFSSYLAEIEPLELKITATLRSANQTQATRIADLRDVSLLQSNQNRLNLIDQKITWGEFNIKRKEISVSFNTQYQQIVGGR